MITEDQLEQRCLDWFQSIGYDYVCGYDIAPDADSSSGRGTSERSDYRQIILHDCLLNRLEAINPLFLWLVWSRWFCLRLAVPVDAGNTLEIPVSLAGFTAAYKAL